MFLQPFPACTIQSGNRIRWTSLLVGISDFYLCFSLRERHAAGFVQNPVECAENLRGGPNAETEANIERDNQFKYGF